MAFEIDNEKATDVLIWWIEGSNGSIDHREKEAVKDVLHDINYSMQTYYEETLMYIGGLGTERLDELVEDAKQYAVEHFSDHRKQKTLALLIAVARSNGKVTEGQEEKLEELQQAFGVDKPEVWKK